LEKLNNTRKKLIVDGMEQILDGLVGPHWRVDSNFKGTPERYMRALEEMFFNKRTELATFDGVYKQMVLVAHHREYTLCPHHMIPVAMDISCAYIPAEEGGVVGMSKLIRMIQFENSEPILQEDLTEAIADQIEAITPKPKGAAVLISAWHGCMQMRGVRTGATAVTEALRGVFYENQETREEFLHLVRMGANHAKAGLL